MTIDLEKRKVVQHNDLITSVARMDTVPLKIFELCVSQLDSRQIIKEQDYELKLSKKEIYDFFKAEDEGKHTRFKEAIQRLQAQSYFRIEKLEKDDGFRYQSIVPIPYIEWKDSVDEVLVRFNREILPYLMELKDNFTQYLLSDISNLNGKYSIILYKWLMMNFNQYKRYGNRQHKNPKIKIDDLRKMTDTIKEYKRFDNFDKRVLKEPLEEINTKTHYVITYEKIRYGNRVEEIQFYIEEKDLRPTAEYNLDKSERYEERFNEHEDKLKGSIDEYLTALRDPFIERLIKKEIIHSADMEKILNIYEKVVPLYQEMIIIKGQNIFRPYETFENHVDYIKEHIVGSPKKFQNIVEYLRVSAEQYNDRLRRQMNENN